MTDRKFTPPTEFPATFMSGCDQECVVLGSGPDGRFIGYSFSKESGSIGRDWDAKGCYGPSGSKLDLQDTPKVTSKWQNIYADEVVLPEWSYILRIGTEEDFTSNQHDGGGPDAYFANVYVKNPNIHKDTDRFPSWSGTPARAWLIAILNALIAKETADG